MASTTAKPATGKLGIMVVGLGAVSTTFITGVLMARKGLAKPVGSTTQYDRIRVGRGENKKYLKQDIRARKAIDLIYANADITDVEEEKPKKASKKSAKAEAEKAEEASEEESK